MCTAPLGDPLQAMNRSLPNVILGGYEMAAKPKAEPGAVQQLVHQVCCVCTRCVVMLLV
jgi:hypothetical protein